MLGAQESDDLCRLRIGQRIGEGRHLLPAVLNLLGDLGWRPELIFSNIQQCRRFSCAFATRTVTTGAPGIVEKNRTGHFIGFLMGGKCRSSKHSGEKDDN